MAIRGLNEGAENKAGLALSSLLEHACFHPTSTGANEVLLAPKLTQMCERLFIQTSLTQDRQRQVSL